MLKGTKRPAARASMGSDRKVFRSLPAAARWLGRRGWESRADWMEIFGSHLVYARDGHACILLPLKSGPVDRVPVLTWILRIGSFMPVPALPRLGLIMLGGGKTERLLGFASR